MDGWTDRELSVTMMANKKKNSKEPQINFITISRRSDLAESEMWP